MAWASGSEFEAASPTHIGVLRSKKKRLGAEQPTSQPSLRLPTGAGALTKTRMRTKAPREAATLQVAMAGTSTDWFSNENPLPGCFLNHGQSREPWTPLFWVASWDSEVPGRGAG